MHGGFVDSLALYKRYAGEARARAVLDLQAVAAQTARLRTECIEA